jgi:hypothetical protein
VADFHRASRSSHHELSVISPFELKLDPFLSHNTLPKGVFDFAHFRDHVCDFDDLGLGIAPGQDYMEHLWFFFKKSTTSSTGKKPYLRA